MRQKEDSRMISRCGAKQLGGVVIDWDGEDTGSCGNDHLDQAGVFC